MMLKNPFRSQQSDNAPFSEESYKSLMPFLSNINSYLQTFLSVFSSSMMALNAALITVILSREAEPSHTLFKGGVGFFIGAMALYLCAFIILLFTKKRLLKHSMENNVSIKTIAYYYENKTRWFISSMLASAIVFFICFILLLNAAIN